MRRVEQITADTIISEVLAQRPGAAHVFAELGLGCPSCFAASMEPLSAVAGAHDVSLEVLLGKLNALETDTVLREST